MHLFDCFQRRSFDRSLSSSICRDRGFCGRIRGYDRRQEAANDGNLQIKASPRCGMAREPAVDDETHRYGQKVERRLILLVSLTSIAIAFGFSFAVSALDSE